MPRGDRTGPSGLGPRTGRALGFCAGYDTPGFTKGNGSGMGRGYGYGYGMGRGRGGGMGYGRGRGGSWQYNDEYPESWGPVMSRSDEIKMLKAQSESLKRSQKEIEKRLLDLEAGEE